MQPVLRQAPVVRGVGNVDVFTRRVEARFLVSLLVPVAPLQISSVGHHLHSAELVALPIPRVRRFDHGLAPINALWRLKYGPALHGYRISRVASQTGPAP